MHSSNTSTYVLSVNFKLVLLYIYIYLKKLVVNTVQRFELEEEELQLIQFQDDTLQVQFNIVQMHHLQNRLQKV